MDYRESIQRAIDYIEDNLCFDLRTEELAAAAGYSKYHFIRIFTEAIGLTPADYIRKRRLSQIADELDRYSGSIAELAFRYGFNSKENFIRAFKAEHHILPTEYKKAKNSLRLYPRAKLDFQRTPAAPQIVTLAPFSLTVLESDEEYPPHFWNKYNCRGVSRRLSGGKTVADYGVSSWDCTEGRLRYYIGIRTDEAAGDTLGTLQLAVEGGMYAVFTTEPAGHFAFVNNIRSTWAYINAEWLPSSGCERTGGLEFESYVEDSRTYSEQIYIPIKAVLPVRGAADL